MTLEELTSAVAQITDKLVLVDQVLSGKGEVAFRCAHSGLYYPEDYIKQWGIKYGIGLGPRPVSECWDSDYTKPPYDSRLQTNVAIENIMHPIRTTFAQVDFVVLPPGTLNGNRLILAIDDRRGYKRKEIVLEKQLVNPKSKVAQFIEMAQNSFR